MQMNEEIFLTVAVTCYNESKHIFQTLDNVFNALEASGFVYEVLVIDDASSDNSIEKIEQFISQHPKNNFQFIKNRVNRGFGNNYVEGAFLAKGKYYRICCGDDAEPQKTLEDIYSYIGRAEVIIPYQLHENIACKTMMRKQLSHLFTFIVNKISGYKIKYYNGLAIIPRHLVLRWHPSSYGFGFQADIITRLLDEGVTYLQVASGPTIDRKVGASSAFKMRNILSVGHTLLEVAIRRIRRGLYGREMTKPTEIFLDGKK
jgi:glycosyltransferase involved in cell wall biosynthesis